MEYAVIDGQQVELTEWFMDGAKPVYKGWYQARLWSVMFPKQLIELRLHWSGKAFYYGNKRARFHGPTPEWRGLSHPPGAT